MELDISANNLTKLRPKTFDGNDGMQILKAAQNPLSELMAYQFPPLKNLKTLDFSHCQLKGINKKAFQNLGHGVESIFINHNQLRYVYLFAASI
jgi:Leucine-rich repeat (LRR) protein